MMSWDDGKLHKDKELLEKMNNSFQINTPLSLIVE